MIRTLGEWITQHVAAGLPPDLATIVAEIASASAELASQLRTAPLDGLTGATESVNVQGEVQKPLDILANDIFMAACHRCAGASYAVSEELDLETPIHADGRFAVIFDPLDGSSNLDVNVTVGSIFSVIPAAFGDALLSPGNTQVFAGFAAYGPATSLVLTFGTSVDLFVLGGDGVWQLARSGLTVPVDTTEIAINSSREMQWDKAISGYVAACFRPTKHSDKVYNSRWVGSMVADILRILIRGGVFLYPAGKKAAKTGGRLRLLYEANPMALLITTAGGAATTGKHPILDLTPTELHQRVAVILGSRNEVDNIRARYVLDS
ncbi:class 1 fructose-bisphosphatase (plasmid) [Agrobacterium vitis]|uniref:class 1 fructose-bisphosphatase n=1 Tax=Agrobacterium vitis TaxID=373 RepID=UPI0012E7AA11